MDQALCSLLHVMLLRMMELATDFTTGVLTCNLGTGLDFHGLSYTWPCFQMETIAEVLVALHEYTIHSRSGHAISLTIA